jgi:tetratricopeptide (TPR) repeat protein
MAHDAFVAAAVVLESGSGIRRCLRLAAPAARSISVEQNKYFAFISYSHRDSAWADWLHKSIESYRPPKKLVGTASRRGVVPKRLTPVFRDRDELPSATDLGALINAALQESACQIIICSPQSAQSRWVNEEILAFKRLGREDSIFCLIIGGEPNATDMPGREQEECFPQALRFRLGADGNLSEVRTEPIAADARPGKDGRNNAKLKLIAGVLGVGFDLLRRREQQRRNRRLAIVAGGAMAGMVLTSGLAAYALVQRAAAQRQTVRAEAEAETAKQTTNFLVDLFKISDPSEARGNTVTAREMLDKGAARIDRELAQQPAIQATLMDTLGTVYMGLGLYGQARPLLDGAVTKRRHFAADPGVLSTSLSHLGEVQFLQANYAVSEQNYRQAIAYQSAQPDTPANRAALARSVHGLGEVLEHQGRYTDAEQSFRKALELQRQVLGPVHEDVARTLQDLAKVIYENGDLKAAIPVMRQALAMQRQLNGAQPGPGLADAIQNLGMMLFYDADYDAADKLFLETLAMKRRVLGEHHPEVAISLGYLARIQQNKGNLAGAEAMFREELAIQRQAVGDKHPEVANILNDIAFVEYDRGRKQAALATEREAYGILRELFPGDHPDVARFENRIGFWLTQDRQYAEADRELQEALAMRRRLLGDQHPDVAASLAHVAILKVARGQYAAALASARSAVDIYTTALSATHWKTAIGESAAGAALSGLGRYAEAERLLDHSVAILSKDPDVPAAYRELAQRYLAQLHERQSRAQRTQEPTPAMARMQ